MLSLLKCQTHRFIRSLPLKNTKLQSVPASVTLARPLRHRVIACVVFVLLLEGDTGFQSLLPSYHPIRARRD